MITRIRWFITLVFVLIGASALCAYPGNIQVTWLGHIITMPIGLFVCGIVLFCLVFIVLHRWWHKLWKLPVLYHQFLMKRKQVRGHTLIIDSITALQAGQPKEAQDLIQLAKELLPNHSLTVLLAAQSTLALNDFEHSEKIYTDMLSDPRIMFLGIRGLILCAKYKKNWLEVRRLLGRAFQMRPDSPWVLSELESITVILERLGHVYLGDSINLKKYLSKERILRLESAILWCQYQKTSSLMKNEEKCTLLFKIHEGAPDWVEITLTYALLLSGQNHHKKARSILYQAYQKNPNRLLAEAWIKINPDQDVTSLYHAIQELTNDSMEHYESAFILAKTALYAHLIGQATHHIETLRQLGDTEEIRHLSLERQRIATSYEAYAHHNGHSLLTFWVNLGWCCKKCHKCQNWDVVCSYCYSVDSLVWYGNNKTVGVSTAGVMTFNEDHPQLEYRVKPVGEL